MSFIRGMQERQEAEPIFLLRDIVNGLRPALWPRVTTAFCPSSHAHAALLLLSGGNYGAVVKCGADWLIADVPRLEAHAMVYEQGAAGGLHYLRLAGAGQPLSDVAAILLAYG